MPCIALLLEERFRPVLSIELQWLQARDLEDGGSNPGPGSNFSVEI